MSSSMKNSLNPNLNFRLVFGLSNLEFISFGSMGKVLSQDQDLKIKGIASKRKRQTILKLTHFNEIDPSFMDIPRLQLLCPNIQVTVNHITQIYRIDMI